LQEKYLKAGETSVQDVYRRVARALASVEAPDVQVQFEALFLANLQAGAIGAGRIMSAAGAGMRIWLDRSEAVPHIRAVLARGEASGGRGPGWGSWALAICLMQSCKKFIKIQISVFKNQV
jgi:hypothetical protein